MKRNLLLLITTLFIAAGTNAADDTLPILKVILSGSITDEYKTGTMQLTDTDGSVIEMNAKFKTRGATAKQYSMKPSFNMKLRDENWEEKDSCLLGIRSCSSWILDAMAIDRICMRNRVCFDIWNEMYRLPYETKFNGRCGTKGKFVEVYINNKYYGIYCLSDRINRKLLDLKKTQVDETTGDVTFRGILYKHGCNVKGTDEQGNEWLGSQENVGYFNNYEVYVIRWHDCWEVSYPEDDLNRNIWSPLDDLYATYKSYQKISESFYLENMAALQILTTALSIVDNWGNKNHYISIRNAQADGDKKRAVWEPWDLDTGLGGDCYGKAYGENLKESWTVANVSSNAPGPFALTNGNSEYKKLLKETWAYASGRSLSVESVKSKLYKYRDLFNSTGAWERSLKAWSSWKYKPCYVEDLDSEIEYIIAWYKRRYAEMDKYFGVTDADRAASVEIITNDEPESDAIYDLHGRKVAQPTKGIYIQNGRKYIK